jgi:Domain of unknown function (DUF4062)/Ig-like domain from next to BRCA1 gene
LNANRIEYDAPVKRRVFLSSTVRDLRPQRTKLKVWLEQHAPIGVECWASDHPDFPVTPDLQVLDPYTICLENLGQSDYVVQLLKAAYGAADIAHNGERVSITHMEYRKAAEQRKPVFSLIYDPLWEYWKTRDVQGATEAGIDPRLFSLIDEMNSRPSRQWITAIRSLAEAKVALESSLFGFDDSQWGQDLGVSDGALVRVNAVINKGWRIKNNGMVIWESRFLEEVSRTDSLSPLDQRVPIPRTLPGEHATVWVRLKAGKSPATNVRSYWKMIDRDGRQCFPRLEGVYCNVSIVY